jgi:hypothetical protein
MELLVVLGIMGMIATVAANIVPFSARDQECYEATVEIMDRIEQALIGVPPIHLAGERRYMGYIADMGELPELLGEAGQPAGLWTDELAAMDDTVSNLPAWGYTGTETRLWIGWHGPYMDAPAGSLRDGWGNPIIFERFDISDEGTEIPGSEGRNLRFKSLGADGVRDSGEEGSGYEADIERVIREKDYLGSLAGYLGEDVLSVEIHFPSRGQLTSIVLGFEEDGYFFSGADAEALLPMGTRSLRTTGEGATEKTVLFSLEPTGNFLGTLDTSS